MSNIRRIGIGLLGLGVVGRGVVRILKERSKYFRSVRGIDISLSQIAVRDLEKPRSVDLPEGILTNNAEAVIDHPDTQIVVEVMGGINPTLDLSLRTLELGKNLVTANKALLAEKGELLFKASDKHGGTIAFEASVCGGIPIIRSLVDGLVANHFKSFYGILNGTTNYILTKMSDSGSGFDEMLKEAQNKGFAEANPTLDINGTDAAQKLAIICRLAFRKNLSTKQIFKEGISHITPLDIEFAKELGYRIKLLAIAKESNNKIEARVHPVLIPASTLLANIKDEFNAVEIVGNATGPQVFYGRGAGELPTASAVVSDIITLAERRLSNHTSPKISWSGFPKAVPVPPAEIHTRFYCRFTVYDQPGVLAKIANIFSTWKISLANVIQHGRSETKNGTVPLIITTHNAQESAMQQAIKQINNLPVVTEKSQTIRIEEF